MMGMVEDHSQQYGEVKLDENRCIRLDMPCQKCGYNLRGCPWDGSCPECGLAVKGMLNRALYRQRQWPIWLQYAGFLLVWIPVQTLCQTILAESHGDAGLLPVYCLIFVVQTAFVFWTVREAWRSRLLGWALIAAASLLLAIPSFLPPVVLLGDLLGYF